MALIPKPVRWEVALDYARLTWSNLADDKAIRDILRKVAYTCVVDAEGQVPDFEPWAWLGYVGSKSEHAAYGSGAQGSILQVSGGAADVLRHLDFPSGRASRCDVAITLWYEQDNPMVAERVAERSAAVSKTRGAVAWSVNLRRGYGKGDTAYIGARTSDRYIRVYDKWRQSKEREEYKYAWRVEVEYKNAPAAALWARAHKGECTRETLAATVREECRRKGVWLPALEPATCAPVVAAPSVRTSVDSRLAWLQGQVAPAVEKLLQAGVSRDTILTALGLQRVDPDVLARSYATATNKEGPNG